MKMTLPSQSMRLSFSAIELGTRLSFIKAGTITSPITENGIFIQNNHL